MLPVKEKSESGLRAAEFVGTGYACGCLEIGAFGLNAPGWAPELKWEGIEPVTSAVAEVACY